MTEPKIMSVKEIKECLDSGLKYTALRFATIVQGIDVYMRDGSIDQRLLNYVAKLIASLPAGTLDGLED